MRARLLVVSFIAFAAVPATAAGPLASEAPTAASGALAPLAATPPLGGPILAGVEGAEGNGAPSILYGTLYVGLAGTVIGLGVGLIENGNYGRDIAIGAGVGILVGAALGATHVFGDSRPFPSSDGLASTDRDPVLRGPRYAGVALGV